MDLVNGIVRFQHASTMSQVQMRVARKMLDMQQFQGAAAIQLIEAASAQTVGAGDALVAAATGLGGKLDVVA